MITLSIVLILVGVLGMVRMHPKYDKGGHSGDFKSFSSELLFLGLAMLATTGICSLLSTVGERWGTEISDFFDRIIRRVPWEKF